MQTFLRSKIFGFELENKSLEPLIDLLAHLEKIMAQPSF